MMRSIHMIITILVLPIFMIRAWLLNRFGNDKQRHRELKRYPQYYLGLRGRKVVVHNSNPEYDAAIYISNHQSHNDIFVLLEGIQEPFRFIAKKELFTNPFIGVFMKFSKSYPLDREEARASLKLFKQAIADNAEGVSLAVFPEGTRSRDKEMLPFKDGMFSIIRKAQTPIIPMYIKDGYIESVKTIHVYFGEAIEASEYNAMRGPELSLKVREAMDQLMKQAYA